jgi:hypothetical protein
MPFSKNLIIKLSGKTSVKFSFPENWKADGSTTSRTNGSTNITMDGSGSDGTQTSLTSPSGNISVGLSLYNYYVRDQTCPSDYFRESFLSFDSQALSNYNGVSYVQYISKDSGSYGYEARLQKTPKYSSQQMLINSVCEMNINSLVEYKLADGNAGHFGDGIGTFQAYIDFQGDIKGPGSSADMYSLNYIESSFNSSEFKTAKNILLSAKFIED